MSATVKSSSPDANALAGWNIVVTRPRDSAAPLILGLLRHGAHVLRLPAQEIEANPDFDWGAAMGDCDRIDDWVFTSPAAVKCANPLIERGLPDGHVFAVGSSSARMLRRLGCTAIAPDRDHNSEALLDLRGLMDAKGRRIAVVTAPGGRGLIATTLRERGALVIEWPVYRRHRVAWSPSQLDGLSSASDPLLTMISSTEALDILATSLPPALWQRLRDSRWIASSTRLETALLAHGASRIDLAESALAGDLLRATLALS